MFGFEAWHVWLAAALLLAVAELLGTEFVLLALGVSCLGGAAVAGLTDAGLAAQLLVSAGLAAVFVPVAVLKLRHVIRPPGGYGVTGSGAERGGRAEVVEQAGEIGIKYRGDFLPSRLADGRVPEPGTSVRILRIRGITAVVAPASDPDHKEKRNQ